MNVSILGMGYVGCVSAGCLAKNGHNVIGLDIDPKKISMINEGKATIIENEIDHYIMEGWKQGGITASDDCINAVVNSDISIICVGTPSMENGLTDLSSIFAAVTQIGEGIARKNSFHTVIIRSTVPPGTNDEVLKKLEAVSHKRKNTHFGVVSNPEFLREGTAVYDYYNPPFILAGSESDMAINVTRELYSEFDVPFITEEPVVCELVKYSFNSFHALKISFANEVGNICKTFGVDSHVVMDIFCKDTKLNISPKYLKPGFAYGGYCLPKDLRALVAMAEGNGVCVPLLKSISQSNEKQKERAFEIIKKCGKSKIGIIGLSFKAGTDDIRESPMLDIVCRLLEDGYSIKIYDPKVNISSLTGRNREALLRKIPNVDELFIKDIHDLAQCTEVIVVANQNTDFENYIKTGNSLKEKVIVDLARIKPKNLIEGEYHGICW